MAHMDIALPLFSGVVTSAMTAPPMVIGAEQAAPAMKRKTKNIAVLVLAAQPIVKAMKTTLQI
jgi:hypothetical protein